jgi:hypothetical protein
MSSSLKMQSHIFYTAGNWGSGERSEYRHAEAEPIIELDDGKVHIERIKQSTKWVLIGQLEVILIVCADPYQI